MPLLSTKICPSVALVAALSRNAPLDDADALDVLEALVVIVASANGVKVAASVGALVTAVVGAAEVVGCAVGAPLGASVGAVEVADPMLGACVVAAPSGKGVSTADGVFSGAATAELQAVNAIAAIAASASTASRLVCRNILLLSISSGALWVSDTSCSREMR